MSNENLTTNNFINIIKWSLSDKCKGPVGLRIKQKIDYLYEVYGTTKDEILYDLLYYFITYDHKAKYDRTKGKPTTFIPYYVNNYLNNLGRQYKKIGMVGEFRRYKDLANSELRMDVSQIGLSRSHDDGEEKFDFNTFLEYKGLTACCYSSDNPEQILIAKETLALAVKVIGLEEVQVLIGQVDLHDRIDELGISRATYYRRLVVRKQVFKNLLNMDELN